MKRSLNPSARRTGRVGAVGATGKRCPDGLERPSSYAPSSKGAEAHDGSDRPQPFWTPMRDRLFVRRIEEPEKSGLLIMVPDKYWNALGHTKNSAHIGEVLSVGPKVREARAGWLVAFGRFTDYDNDGVVLIQEADIMFRIDKPVKIGIDKFTHNEVGVDRAPGSLEALYD